MRLWFLAMALCLCLSAGLFPGCDSTRGRDSSPGRPSPEPVEKAGQAVDSRPSRLENAGVNRSDGKESREECIPGRAQTGPGCQMEGILAATAPLKRPGGAISRCLKDSFDALPGPGSVRIKFSLTPAGQATGFQTVGDSYGRPELCRCLTRALGSVSYPVPGDVPCEVIYPFQFVP